MDSRILTGKLHTTRRDRRFAYYISNRLIRGGTDVTGWRLPAEALEACVQRIVTAHLRKSASGHVLVHTPDATGASEIALRAQTLADTVEHDPQMLAALIISGTLADGRLQLQLSPDPIVAALSVPGASLSAALLSVDQPFAILRRGVETRIIAGETIAAPDKVLQRTLANAHLWASALRDGTSLSEISKTTGHSGPYLRNRIALAFLAPKLQAAILEGHQPPDLPLARLVREGIPIDCDAQARMFAIG